MIIYNFGWYLLQFLKRNNIYYFTLLNCISIWNPDIFFKEHPILYNLSSYWLYYSVGDSLDFCVRFARFNEIRLVIDGRWTSRISWSRNFLWAVVVIAVDHVIARRHVPVHVQTHRTHGFSDGNLKCPLLLLLLLISSLCQQTN